MFDISDFPPTSADNHCCTSSNECKIDDAEQTSDQGTLKIWKNNRATQDRSKWVVEERWGWGGMGVKLPSGKWGSPVPRGDSSDLGSSGLVKSFSYYLKLFIS